jgi:hypothetical protein
MRLITESETCLPHEDLPARRECHTTKSPHKQGV